LTQLPRHKHIIAISPKDYAFHSTIGHKITGICSQPHNQGTISINMQTDKNKRLELNNFDLIRLILAAIVLLVHSYQLSQFPRLEFLEKFLSSEIAVKAFFVISGFLIFMSYERSNSLRSYIKKRATRIYPAYVAIIILCAIGLFLISTKNASDYFTYAWLKYVFSNLIFLNSLQPSLPGVFEHNHLQAINGALWTIKIEVMFYATVPLLVLCMRRFGKARIIALTYLLSISYAYLLNSFGAKTGATFYTELGRQLPGQLSYFIAGTFLYYFLPFFEKNVVTFLSLATTVLLVNGFFALPLLVPIAIGIIVIFFALFFYLGNFGKYGDFSYGVYIMHFPIIQTLLASERFNGKPFLFLATTIVLTGICAISMWHLVENRFLHRKSTSPHLEKSLQLEASTESPQVP
jgi:peptidoglycan/LPS O-acetylase OafA/YrhL